MWLEIMNITHPFVLCSKQQAFITTHVFLQTGWGEIHRKYIERKSSISEQNQHHYSHLDFKYKERE